MIDIDTFEKILDDVAGELPKEFYRELNSGILLLPQAKISPYAVADDLYIMGEYIVSSSMGRMIRIYYGSFEKNCSHLSEDALKERIREVLYHEFTHHMESLAGERGLEIKDEIQLRNYLRHHRRSHRYRNKRSEL